MTVSYKERVRLRLHFVEPTKRRQTLSVRTLTECVEGGYSVIGLGSVRRSLHDVSSDSLHLLGPIRSRVTIKEGT